MSEQGSAVPVFFVASHAQLGGAEGVLTDLVGELAPEWRAGAIVLAEGPLAERLEATGIDVEVIAAGRRAGMLSAAARVRARLRKMRPVVVHANGVKAALICAIATRGTGIRVLWHKHDTARDGALGRWVAKRCALVVGVSHSSVESLKDVPGVRVCVVENGVRVPPVDREAARSSLAGELGAGSDEPLVAMVGRIHPGKGQATMVEACSRIREGGTPVRLVIAGAPDPYEPAYEGEVRELVSRLGMERSVSFLGFRDDVVQVTAGCDALAMPSTRDEVSGWREGFPLAPLEAMAVGTPVVAYDEPGIAEAVGVCGALVPSGDEDALRAALTEVLNSPERAASLAACGRERMHGFTLERSAARMADAYREAAA